MNIFGKIFVCFCFACHGISETLRCAGLCNKVREGAVLAITRNDLRSGTVRHSCTCPWPRWSLGVLQAGCPRRNSIFNFNWIPQRQTCEKRVTPFVWQNITDVYKAMHVVKINDSFPKSNIRFENYTFKVWRYYDPAHQEQRTCQINWLPNSIKYHFT